MSNRLLLVAEEVIINLLLHLDVDSIINFFEPGVYSEFNYLLQDKYFLHELSVKNEIPNINNLDELKEYSDMNFKERLRTAIQNDDDVDGVIRILPLIELKPLTEIKERYTGRRLDSVNDIMVEASKRRENKYSKINVEHEC